MTYDKLYALVKANGCRIVFDPPVEVCGEWCYPYMLRGFHIEDGVLYLDDTYWSDRSDEWDMYTDRYHKCVCETVEKNLDRFVGYDRNLF